MSEYGTYPETEVRTVRFERTLPGPIERVWAYLTESDKRRTWLASGEMELAVGGSVELKFLHSELSTQPEPIPDQFSRYEAGATLHGHITRLEVPRLLSFSWDEGRGADSEVSFELSEHGADVKLIVTHRHRPEVEGRISVTPGWHTHLGILEDLLLGRERRPFWATYVRLAEEYKRRLAGG